MNYTEEQDKDSKNQNMAGSAILSPDLKFIRDIKRLGGETVKKCYQCATCSGICPLSSENSPFPRKEMIMTQLGMKNELFRDSDIWYCHNCNDCSKLCPRGARPGDILGALRAKFITENSVPKFLGKIVTNPSYTLFAFFIPALLLFAILVSLGHLSIPDGKIVYSRLFPVESIDLFFSSFVAISLIMYIISLRRFWLRLRKENNPQTERFGKALIQAVAEFLLHRKFSKCDVNSDRKNGHLMVFYGFVGLFITTSWVAFYYWFFHINTPISLGDPLKWVANTSALLLIIGTLILIVNRLKDKGVNSRSSSFDWTFAIIVLLIGLTGLSTEIARLSSIADIAYPLYFIHLLFVFYIIVYFPYSKLAHFGYRLLAITFHKMAGTDVA